ncbi:Cytochrome P450 1A2 (CYPIA2) (Cholesterol 25-hydroxylase) (Hydroperoxy icosatetraenoate dehydratase), partial [Durusdinium trenchii]
MKTKQDEYAFRPVLKSFEAITHGQGVAMNNGARWRMIRTVLQQSVTNKQKGVEAEEMIKEEVGFSLAWLREECARGRGASYDFRQLARRESLNVFMRKIFSFRFKEGNSVEYMEVQDWLRIIFEHMAQGSPSDFMPIAKYFPNAEEELYFDTCLKMEKFIDSEIDRHKANLDQTKPEDYDFIHSMLKVQEAANKEGKETITDVDIRVCCWDSMAGGIDTSATSMEWLIYLLINHKPVLRKMQKILDEVVGPDRLPCLEDIPKLEYLTAILDENFRFKHFAPQGLPHEAGVDTTILGYNVPKGTQVFFNYYSLHFNPEYWDKPEEFRPERFLEEERALLDTALHPETFFPKMESYKFV